MIEPGKTLLQNEILQTLINDAKLQQLMVQGTTSDAGKSTLVCALGRIFSNANIDAAPFKPQNMALNSAVAEDGGEIGRAQALQALACRTNAHSDMNPVLLKPSSDTTGQVIVQGKVIGNLPAQGYMAYKKTARKAVLESYQRLQQNFDVVLVEGAGSPAEINLRENDIANMGFAEDVDCPVILIADIDRGGVFAHIIGTLACLSESEQNRVIGFVINRFRGDQQLLQPGIDWLEQKTNKPVLGVLPYLQGLYLDAEDALDAEQISREEENLLTVVVPVFPRISNHTDFDAFRAHPQVNLRFVGPEQTPPPADLVILPGSKNTRADLAWLQQQKANWPRYLQHHLRYGGKVIGICGGLQMLGQSIEDPDGIEDRPGVTRGLNFLPIQTRIKSNKTLLNTQGELALPGHPKVSANGYEIHAGISAIDGLQDVGCGWLSDDQHIFATYWHGLFDTPDVLHELLQWSGLDTPETLNYNSFRDQQLNRLAESVANHIDWSRLKEQLERFNQSQRGM